MVIEAFLAGPRDGCEIGTDAASTMFDGAGVEVRAAGTADLIGRREWSVSVWLDGAVVDRFSVVESGTDAFWALSRSASLAEIRFGRRFESARQIVDVGVAA